MTDGTGRSSYSYDPLHRLTSTTDGGGQKIGYRYDITNNQTSITIRTGSRSRRHSTLLTGFPA